MSGEKSGGRIEARCAAMAKGDAMSPRVVFKYPFPSDPKKAGEPMRVDLGVGNSLVSLVRHVGVDPQGDGFVPCLWIEHRPGSTMRVERAFRFFGTGHQIPDDALVFHGSVVTPRGLVWHVYEVRA